MFVSNETDLLFLETELNLSKSETVRFADKIVKKIHIIRRKNRMNPFEKFLKREKVKEGTTVEEVTDADEKVVIYKLDISNESLITKGLAVIGTITVGAVLGKSVGRIIHKMKNKTKEISITPLKSKTVPVSKVKYVGKIKPAQKSKTKGK